MKCHKYNLEIYSQSANEVLPSLKLVQTPPKKKGVGFIPKKDNLNKQVGATSTIKIFSTEGR